MAKHLTNEDAEVYVQELMPGLQHAFQLGHWDVHVFLVDKIAGRDPGTRTSAEVAVWPLSEYAEISVVPAMHADKHALARSLRHELAHVLHADMERAAKLAWRTADKRARRIIQEAYYDAAEQLVSRIERMFDVGIGISATALADRGERRRVRNAEEALE